MLKNLNNMAFSAKNWLSQPKRFPTSALDGGYIMKISAAVALVDQNKHQPRLKFD